MKAAIYARLSSFDPVQGNLDQQVAKGRDYARSQGWNVVGEYVEPGRSGHKETGRKQLARLKDDIAAGKVDVVIVRHLDRLYRNAAQALLFRELCRVVAYEQGLDTIDRGSRMSYAVNAALAEEERDIKRDRALDYRERWRKKGRPRIGGWRQYGFEQDGITQRPAEVKLIRKTGQLIAKGGSLRQAAKMWNETGVTNNRGKPIVANNIRKCLLTTPLLDKETTRSVRAILTDPARRTNGMGANRKRFLVNGIARCGTCGERMYGIYATRKRTPTYRGSCTHMRMVAETLDSAVRVAVTYALGLAGELFEPPEGRGEDLRDELDRLDVRLANKRRDYAEDLIDAEALRMAQKIIESQAQEIRRQLTKIAREEATRETLTELVTQAKEGLDFDRWRMLVEQTVDHIEVRPAKENPHDRVKIIWQEPYAKAGKRWAKANVFIQLQDDRVVADDGTGQIVVDGKLIGRSA